MCFPSSLRAWAAAHIIRAGFWQSHSWTTAVITKGMHSCLRLTTLEMLLQKNSRCFPSSAEAGPEVRHHGTEAILSWGFSLYRSAAFRQRKWQKVSWSFQLRSESDPLANETDGSKSGATAASKESFHLLILSSLGFSPGFRLFCHAQTCWWFLPDWFDVCHLHLGLCPSGVGCQR